MFDNTNFTFNWVLPVASATMATYAAMGTDGGGGGGGWVSEDHQLQHLNNSQQQVPNFRELVVSSYLITFSLGIVGNSLVIFVIAYYGDVRRKSVANYYILNLAAADLAFVFSLPFFCYATATKHWPFGSVACKVLTTMHEVNRYASVYTLVALSVDRLLASFYYCAKWRTPLKGKIACFVIWVTSLGISLPYVIYSEAVEQGSTVSCRMTWPSRDQGQGFQVSFSRIVTYFDFVAAFTVPVVAIFISYGVLAYRMQRLVGRRTTSRRRSREVSVRGGQHHSQPHHHHSNHLTHRQPPHQQLQKKLTASISVRLNSDAMSLPQNSPTTTAIVATSPSTNSKQQSVSGSMTRRRPSVQMTRTVLAIVIIFVVCHAPNSAMKLVALHQRERVEEALQAGQPLQPSISQMRTFAYINSLALVLLFLNSCVNPIIYGLSNRNFRQLYLDAIRKCCSVICRTRHRPSSDRQMALVSATVYCHSSSIATTRQRMFEMTSRDHTAGLDPIGDTPATSSVVRPPSPAVPLLRP